MANSNSQAQTTPFYSTGDNTRQNWFWIGSRLQLTKSSNRISDQRFPQQEQRTNTPLHASLQSSILPLILSSISKAGDHILAAAAAIKSHQTNIPTVHTYLTATPTRCEGDGRPSSKGKRKRRCERPDKQTPPQSCPHEVSSLAGGRCEYRDARRSCCVAVAGEVTKG